jgi:hypothetical protein
MSWFRHPESGQVFEAVGIWERYARQQGCTEIPAPGTVQVAPPAPPADPEPQATEEPTEAAAGATTPNTITPLPTDFPHRAQLEAAGVATLEQLSGMTQTQLTALPGIGKVSAKAILSAL